METLLSWVENAKPIWVYLAVFFSAFIENVFTPLPGDTATVFGAYLAGMGRLSFAALYAAATIGGVAGFMGQYLLGRFVHALGEKRGRLLKVNMTSIAKIEGYFRKYGYLVILLNRFLYGLRFFVAIFAGMSKLPWIKTLLCAVIGTAVWNLLLVYLGWSLGENWGLFKTVMWKYNRIFISLAVIVGAAIAAKYIIGKKKKASL